MKALVIDTQTVRRNAAAVKERAGGRVIYAVLTGDAGGAGLIPMARLLRAEGIGRFAVSEPADAAALRKAGFVDEELLMLRSTTDRGELEELMDLNVVCTIGSHDTGVALNGLAEARSTVVEAHIQVDAGMGYGGFLAAEPDKILSMYRYLPNVALSGIYTQLQVLPGGGRGGEERLKDFSAVMEAIHGAGFETGTVHAGGTSALFSGALEGLEDLGGVQVGSAFLGFCRPGGGRGGPLRPAAWGEARLEEVQWLPKGHTVGGQHPVTLKKPTRVGVLPVGWQDGFGLPSPREPGLLALLGHWRRSRRRTVRLGEQRVRVIGSVGAVETLVDVTDLKCAPGDTAVFDLDPLLARGFTTEFR